MLLRDGDSYSPSERPAVLAPLVKRDGSITTDPGRIYITLTHLEEERLENKKNVYLPDRNGSQYLVFQPPIRLNAYVLFTSVQANYTTALRDLSHVAIFFQHYNVFSSAQYPSLNASVAKTKQWQRIEDLTVQLFSLTYEQQSYLWSCLGAKYEPSLLYKFRVLVVFDQDTEQSSAPILEGVDRELVV